MAIVIRYFGTASAGAGDGTTWADRDQFVSGGTYSTVLTAFDFSGSDSLLCYVGPGTHTTTNQLDAADFSVASPTRPNPLHIHGCDGSGVPLAVIDEGWTCDQPNWDDSTLPVWATTTNIATINISACVVRLMKFTATGRSGLIVASLDTLDWCSVVNSQNNTASIGVSGVHKTTNCIISMAGTSYNYGLNVANGGSVSNTRVTGNGTSATSGNRTSFLISGNTGATCEHCCSVDASGDGFKTNGAAARIMYRRCLSENSVGDGFLGGASGSSGFSVYEGCYAANSGGLGFNGNSSEIHLLHCRGRDNTSGNFGNTGNHPTSFDNETTESDDATEYNDAASDDFRMKEGASLVYGLGFGVSDAPAAGGAAGGRIIGG